MQTITVSIDHHLEKGLIQATDLASLPVHPTQVYQILFCLVIAFVVWKTRNKWRSHGSQLLFSMLLYGFFRFFNEFFRDPIANEWAGNYFFGLKYAQWFILAGLSILLSVILIKEKYFRNKKADHRPLSGKPLEQYFTAGEPDTHHLHPDQILRPGGTDDHIDRISSGSGCCWMGQLYLFFRKTTEVVSTGSNNYLPHPNESELHSQKHHPRMLLLRNLVLPECTQVTQTK